MIDKYTDKIKKIGIIGGYSDKSTIEYYKIINELMNKKLNGLNNSEILINSVNLEKATYFLRNNLLDNLGEYLKEKVEEIEKINVDVLICACNTFHIVSDIFISNTKIHFLHIADPTGEEIVKMKLKKVILLGTKRTMSEIYFKEYYYKNFKIEILTPEEEDQYIIDKIIFNELFKGIIKDESREKYLNIIKKICKKGGEGVILGCTEIPLLINKTHINVPIFDTVYLHSEKVVNIISNLKI